MLHVGLFLNAAFSRLKIGTQTIRPRLTYRKFWIFNIADRTSAFTHNCLRKLPDAHLYLPSLLTLKITPFSLKLQLYIMLCGKKGAFPGPGLFSSLTFSARFNFPRPTTDLTEACLYPLNMECI